MSLEVRYKDKKVGVATLDENLLCHFKYDEEFIKNGLELSPFMMPLDKNEYVFPDLNYASFRGLPGLLDSSLPDKFGSLSFAVWLKLKNIASKDFNVLNWLAFIGNRGMGALEYYPQSYVPKVKNQEIFVEDLVKFANFILNDQNNGLWKEDKKKLENIIFACSFIGGARAKAIVMYNEKTNSFKCDSNELEDGFSHWVIKLDGIKNNKDKEENDKSYFTRIEYAYYLMAKDAKISMSECRLYQDKNLYHFMTKRFDRTIINGELHKIHMLTLSSLMHYDFNVSRIVSYEIVAKIIKEIEKSSKNIEQFFRRMIFNIVTRNQDDHSKNISFVMNDEGEWSLSPAYDITFAYNPNGAWTSEHQMLINGKTKNLTLDDLLASAKSMGICKERALMIINEIQDVVKNWPTYAAKAFLEEKEIQEIFNQFLMF